MMKRFLLHFELFSFSLVFVLLCWCQTLSYMAERVVGTGSFGVVFQVIFKSSAESSIFFTIVKTLPYQFLNFQPLFSHSRPSA